MMEAYNYGICQEWRKLSSQLPLRIVPQEISFDNLWAISITNDGGIQLWDLSRMEKTIK